MKISFLAWALIFSCQLLSAQFSQDSSTFELEGEFLFRFEQDWNSRKSDGTYRMDRSRWRYRARLGLQYQYGKYISTGLGVRTGQLNKQQDPQITLGNALGEFSTIPISFEKIYLQYNTDKLNLWLGKNTWPFRKLNELFWSDNIFPDGMFLGYTFINDTGVINKLEFRSGYFIMNSFGGTFSDDSNLLGFQLDGSLFNNRIKVFPSLYLFNNMDDIPDGAATRSLEYSIIHLGYTFNLIPKLKIHIDGDLYFNLSDYSDLNGIYTDETEGIVLAVRYGDLKKKNDKAVRLTYQRMERYSAVDYLAQNDWARWDYSDFGSPDGRLTNYQGWELMLGYMLNDRLRLNTRMFVVEQLLSTTDFKENGSRIRVDIDIQF